MTASDANMTALPPSSAAKPSPTAAATALTRKVSLILGKSAKYASELQSTLQGADTRGTDDIDHYIRIAQDPVLYGATRLSESCARDLHRWGREIWNQCIRLRREAATAPPQQTEFWCKARLFGLLLLETSRSSVRTDDKDAEQLEPLLPLAITMSKICLDEGHLDTARLTLQKVAEYLEQSKPTREAAATSTGAETEWQQFEAKYYILRMVLASKDNKPDVVEHMFTKVTSLLPQMTTAASEICIDSIMYLGTCFMSANDYDAAHKWYIRAEQIFRDTLQPDSNLLQDIYDGLIKSLVAQRTLDATQDAQAVLSAAQFALGDRPVILHWQLDILEHSDAEASVKSYAFNLKQLLESLDFTDVSLSRLLHHIDRLSKKHLDASVALLDKLLTKEMLQSTKPQWFDAAFVARFNYVLSDSDALRSTTSLEGLLEHLPSHLSVSQDAAQVVHSLIWRHVRSLILIPDYEQAKLWCQIGLNRLLHKSGDANLAVLGRKIIICNIELKSFKEALENFHRLRDTAKHDMLSQFLLFRIALRTWDQTLAYSSIKQLIANGDKESVRRVLYTCVKEAQHAGDTLCTLSALTAVLHTWEGEATVPSTLPSLLRCIIRLLFLIESQNGANENQATPFPEEVSSVFWEAAKYAERSVTDEASSQVFTASELEWFIKNAYNTGVSNLDKWDPQHLTLIFASCLSFIDTYQCDSLGPDELTELDLMSARSHFIAAAALTSRTRKTHRHDFYTAIRSNVACYKRIIHQLSDNVDEPTFNDLTTKLAALVVFDFEAAVNLSQFDDLQKIIESARVPRDSTAFKAMADCILSSQVPAEVILCTMKSIINEIYELEHFTSDKLARYIRCVFQSLLPLDDNMALRMLDHALQVASESAQVGKAYSSVEVEWLAATTFNHGIDLYAANKREDCQAWLLKAMELSGYLNDRGALKATLTDKFQQLPL